MDSYYASFIGCNFNINPNSDASGLRGIYVRKGGCVRDCKFSVEAAVSSRRTVGYMILTYDALCDSLIVSRNIYPSTDVAYQFAHRVCTVSGEDRGVPRYVSISSTGVVDLSLYTPNTNQFITATISITDILDVRYGRRLLVLPNVSGGSILATGYVYPSGNLTLNLMSGKAVEFPGILSPTGVRVIYQITSG